MVRRVEDKVAEFRRIAGCLDGTVLIRNCKTGGRMSIPAQLTGSHVQFSSKGTYLAVSHRNDEDDDSHVHFQLWHFPSLEPIAWPEQTVADLSRVTVSPDETLVAGIRDDTVAEIRKLSTGELVAECPGNGLRSAALAFAPTGRILARLSTPEAGGGLELWTVAGKPLGPKLTFRGEGMYCLAFAPDGRTLVISPDGRLAVGGGRTWNRQGELTLWDLGPRSPRPVLVTQHYPETVRCVAYSSDGALIGATYKFSAGIVRVLDAKNARDQV